MNKALRTTGLMLGLMLMSAVALAAPRAFNLGVDGLACPFCT